MNKQKTKKQNQTKENLKNKKNNTQINLMNRSTVLPTNEMCVIKRNGTLETLSFDKILNRIKTVDTMTIQDVPTNKELFLPMEQNKDVMFYYSNLTQKVIQQLFLGRTM